MSVVTLFEMIIILVFMIKNDRVLKCYDRSLCMYRLHLKAAGDALFKTPKAIMYWNYINSKRLKVIILLPVCLNERIFIFQLAGFTRGNLSLIHAIHNNNKLAPYTPFRSNMLYRWRPRFNFFWIQAWLLYTYSNDSLIIIIWRNVEKSLLLPATYWIDLVIKPGTVWSAQIIFFNNPVL